MTLQNSVWPVKLIAMYCCECRTTWCSK